VAEGEAEEGHILHIDRTEFPNHCSAEGARELALAIEVYWLEHSAPGSPVRTWIERDDWA
jgi:hypothetical protein